ncbi:MAG: MBL fold metallo-hydrolase [Sphaerochaeta sp.]
MMRVSILIENSLVGHRSLYAEHGLSFLFEDGDQSILFDTGSSDKFLFNALQMKKDLVSVQKVVLSHCHYDHTGGFLPFLEHHHPKELFTGKDFFSDHYEKHAFSHTYLGCAFSEETLKEHQINHHVVHSTTKISDHCHVVSGFRHYNDFEKVPSTFEKFDGTSFTGDDFSDECSIVLEMPTGLQLFVGCAHIGILNIVSHVQSLFSKPIQGIYGGIHLMNASREEIHTVLDALYAQKIERLGLCHCSGPLVAECLSPYEGKMEFAKLGSGSTLFW